MTVARRFKVPSAQTQIVAVIASEDDLARALRLRRPPNFFELRLDAFSLRLDLVRRHIGDLRAPLIITARDSREGGVADLSVTQRQALLREFLPQAAYLDVELNFAAQMRSLLASADRRGVKRIISVHSPDQPVSEATMVEWLQRAHAFAPDIFKIAVRTDSPNQCSELLRFVEGHTQTRIAAMGIGAFGRRSRIKLARHGSVLTYAHLGSAHVAGQLSLSAARAILTRSASV